MNRRQFLTYSSITAVQLAAMKFVSGQQPVIDPLAAEFQSPGMPYRPGCYWWWFNGLVNKEGITRDLEEFKAKGMGEVLLINSSDGLGGGIPQGVKFLSPEWKALFRHALKEASRLGLKVGANLSSGWCMGGPWIPPRHAGRWFLQSELKLSGPQKFAGALPLPGNRDGYDKLVNAPGWKDYVDLPLDQLDYRDTSIVAIPAISKSGNLPEFVAKTNRKDASNFIKAKDVMNPVNTPWQSKPGDASIPVHQVIDLTAKVNNGYLEWDVPAGEWIIIRTGHRMTGSKLMVAQPEADGLSIDWLSHEGVDLQFENLGKVLLKEAGDLAGKTLTYFCDDSFEDGFPNWTEKMVERFKHYRGYDPTPYLPVLRGYLIGSAEISDRFLHDYRKTVADCMADGHYKHFGELCHQHGLEMQNEAAGPSRSGTMCMDALKNLGRSDRPEGEFWLGLKHDEPGGLDEKLGYGTVRLEGNQNKVTKMVACAAHIYGKKTVSAEAFTSWRHWYDYPGSMKQAADRAFCEGVNRFLIHTSTATRPEDGKPGYEYGAGTHFNPNVTWWNKSGPFLQYISRCQYLLQQGLFVADILYYNGDWAPNIVLPKQREPKGYDYDVCNEEVLLTRLSVKNGRIVLPDGMSYRVLVLPDTHKMPVPVLKKIAELVKAGAAVIGPKPTQDPGLLNYPQCDTEIQQIAASINYPNINLKEFLQNIGPDFKCEASIDFIHRVVGDTHLYFVANLSNESITTACGFRITGKQVEIWDPVTGRQQSLSKKEEKGYTNVQLSFAPFQCWFIVFKKSTNKNPFTITTWSPVQELAGAWTVHFDEDWGGPSSIEFDELQDWTKRPEEGIRYYSGTAVYKKQFDVPGYQRGKQYLLHLGVVKHIADIKLNGKKLGIVWTSPWQVDITKALQAKNNLLEIEIVNLWPNRLIGDAALPKEKRRTRTNIKYKPGTPLVSSGLLGPVTIQSPRIRL
jgi:Glycosyl hydrolases family 2, sugar binding domain.